VRPARAERVFERDEVATAFAELSSGLFWQPSEVIAMLWAYFDESGEHGPSGELRTLTIGGLVAPFEAWQQFEKDWRAALRSEGLSAFHRRELGPGRDERFLQIITSHVPHALGFTVAASQIETAASETAYEIGFVDCLLELANISAREDRVSLVFAKHPEFATYKAERYFRLFEWQDIRLSSITFQDPRDIAPLQAADLVAHMLRTDEGRTKLERFCRVHRPRGLQ
jgi:hypothetical protein